MPSRRWRTRDVLAVVGLHALACASACAAGFTPVASLALTRTEASSSLLSDGRVLVAGGQNGVVHVSTTIYNPLTNLWTPGGDLTTGRYQHTATVLASGKVLVAGGTSASGIAAAAELYDPATNAWSGAGTLHAGRRNHTASLLSSGKVLVTGGTDQAGNHVDEAELYDPATNQWSSGGTLGAGRDSHTATVLASGKVLVAGGNNSTGFPEGSVELYNPATNGWSTVAPLGTARRVHTATRLPSGKVLVAAGIGADYLNTAEVYDPALDSWTPTQNGLTQSRSRHSATLLASGKVLVTGGIVAGGATRLTAEIYDPGTDQWSDGGSLNTPRSHHNATLLPTGLVLIAGGVTTGVTPIDAVELYDPSAPAWTAGAQAKGKRYQHAASLLMSGQVLLAGGLNENNNYLASAELYDVAGDTWTDAASLTTARRKHTATLLPSGKILVVGGQGPGGAELTSAELYDPVADHWSSAGDLTEARCEHTATLLPSGKVLIVGGTNGNNCSNATHYLSSVELYDPAGNGWSTVASIPHGRNQHSATLLPNGKLLVAGGFGGAGGRFGAGATDNQLYDETTDSWSNAAPMPVWLVNHTATLLPSGKVLVAGGFADPGVYTANALLYDPAGNTWAPAAPLPAARALHTATLLPSGKVLAAGGYDGGEMATAVLYDPAKNAWSDAPTLAQTHRHHTATIVPTGGVLLGGGASSVGIIDIPRIYDTHLGYAGTRRPAVTNVDKPFAVGFPARVGGTLFTGDSEASAGSVRDSATGFPLLQLRRIDNEQQIFVAPASNSARAAGSLRTADVQGILNGPVALTVFVNGVPGVSRMVSLLPRSAVALDVDVNTAGNRYDALTDGLLVLRYLFGLTGPSLTSGALATTATRTDAGAVKTYLDGIRSALDVDGNNAADALTDGLLILRYLFGLRGNALIAGAVDAQGSRNTATAIETYIQSLMP